MILPPVARSRFQGKMGNGRKKWKGGRKEQAYQTGIPIST